RARDRLRAAPLGPDHGGGAQHPVGRVPAPEPLMQPSAPSAVGRPPRWKAWLLAARPKTLAAGLSPVLMGWAVAAGRDAFAWLPALGALAAALLVQVGANLANDWLDFVK